MNGDLISALKQIERERNIPIEILKEAVEQALTSSYRKTFNTDQNVRVEIDWKTGATNVIATLVVVPRKKDTHTEISLSQARKKMKSGHIVKIHPIDPSLLPDIGDEPYVPEEDELILGMVLDVIVEENPKNFGRIAAQTTKNVIFQKIRDAERDIIFDEYAKKEGDIVSGIIQKSELRNWIVDIGRLEGTIPPQEQVAGEHFRKNERIKVFVLRVEQGTRGPQVVLSRTHPGLVRRLFETEVPEIQQGLIEIHNVVREPGSRSKVSVRALQPNVDPLGACVGPRGSRVQMIVDELRGEKIDIINYTDDPFTFVSNALSPARVMTVTLNPDDKTAIVIVPDGQFSLAIGKEGQNARLAAKLTGWKIDIKSESQMKELEALLKQQEEERKKQLKEEQAKIEEEEIILREEEERLAREEEERQSLLENPPEIPEYILKPEEEERLYKTQKSDEKQAAEVDEYLKEIPADIPVEQYVAMAYGGDLPSAEQPVVHVAAKPAGTDESFAKKKKTPKKKKKRQRGLDYDEEF